MLLIGAAVRFLHMALFGGTLLSPYFYAVDTAFCMLFGLAGLPADARVADGRSYGWINERAAIPALAPSATLRRQVHSESG